MLGMSRVLAVVLALGLFASCASDEPTPDPSPTTPVATSGSTVAIRTSEGIVTLDVEIADDEEERAAGLMFREELEPYDGMAFLWDSPVRASFWMKNTLIPLSVAFWDEAGRIVAILDMEPCADDPCPTYDPGSSFIGALEVDRGRFASEGVAVGDLVELEEVE
jgi:uncharacterized membrane protein (UPF0127 family)